VLCRMPDSFKSCGRSGEVKFSASITKQDAQLDLVAVVDEADDVPNKSLSQEAPEIADTIPPIDHVANMHQLMDDDGVFSPGHISGPPAQGPDSSQFQSFERWKGLRVVGVACRVKKVSQPLQAIFPGALLRRWQCIMVPIPAKVCNKSQAVRTLDGASELINLKIAAHPGRVSLVRDAHPVIDRVQSPVLHAPFM
jgi:hypothetical protein